MKILSANTSEEICYIDKNHVYVKVWDYSKKAILLCIKEDFKKKMWVWYSLGEMIDLSGGWYEDFNTAINRSVNNPYCTIYCFDTYEEMMEQWVNIKYKDVIVTVYKDKE